MYYVFAANPKKTHIIMVDLGTYRKCAYKPPSKTNTSYADQEGGGAGRSGPPPEKSLKYSFLLQYWSVSSENSQSFQASIHCGPSSVRQRNAIKMSFSAIWILSVLIIPLTPPPPKKKMSETIIKLKKKPVRFGPPLDGKKTMYVNVSSGARDQTFVRGFIYIHTLIIQAGKVLVSMRVCAGTPGPSKFDNTTYDFQHERHVEHRRSKPLD